MASRHDEQMTPRQPRGFFCPCVSLLPQVEPHPESEEEALDEFKKFLEEVDPEDFQG